jgi:cysteine and glycine-rich protein
LTVEGESYHKTCFRCAHAGCILTTSNYAALHGILYCKIHFQQLFKEKGSYNHVIDAAKKSTNQEVPAVQEVEEVPKVQELTEEEA